MVVRIVINGLITMDMGCQAFQRRERGTMVEGNERLSLMWDAIIVV
jgi:hypothetical protein